MTDQGCDPSLTPMSMVESDGSRSDLSLSGSAGRESDGSGV